MSLEQHLVQRSNSPLNSGRASPVNPRLRSKEDEDISKKDKNYRRYALAVERVLTQFEAGVEEWADYIRFLGRLLKALQTRPSTINLIPSKISVAKHLSQCLNPALPSGVHQKTLEVYSYIFASLGRDGLASDLSLYLPGLTPALSFAALSVRPNVLVLFERYILDLPQSALRPALKAIILALLPGLEEESSDEYERTLRIFANLKEAVAATEKDTFTSGTARDQYFWQCIFLATITSASRRAGALAYLTRSLPRLGGAHDLHKNSTNGETLNPDNSALLHAIESVASPEPGLLIRSFCAGLADKSVLTQRGFLDLLVTHLPLHSSVLQKKAAQADLDRLIAAATSVVARRDMSLNRRLWAWFLGPSEHDEGKPPASAPVSPNMISPGQAERVVRTRYFADYGLTPLVRSLQAMIAGKSQLAVDKARPLRVCLALMDRWEIGGLVVPALFMPAMQSVWQYQVSEAPKEARTEVLRSANMFFDSVESGLIWSKIATTVSKALEKQSTNPAHSSQLLEHVFFIVSNYNIREEEMQLIHIPMVVLLIFMQIRKLIETSSPDIECLQLALKIAGRIIELVPSRAFGNKKSPPEDRSQPEVLPDGLVVITRIEHFYQDDNHNNDAEQPFTEEALGQILLQAVIDLVASLLTSVTLNIEMDVVISVLNFVLRKIPRAQPRLDTLKAALLGTAVSSSTATDQDHPFPLLATRVMVLEILQSSARSSNWLSEQFIRTLIPSVVAGVWAYLSPSRPKHNVEAARFLWRLQSISDDEKLVESVLVTLMLSGSRGKDHGTIPIEAARRFTVLWTHSPSTTKSAQSRRSSLVGGKAGDGAEAKSSPALVLLERPLTILLDALENPRSELFMHVTNWLQSLPSIEPIISNLLANLTALPFVSRIAKENPVQKGDEDRNGEGDEDLELCLYYMHTVLHIIQHSPANSWRALAAPYLGQELGDVVISHQEFLARLSLNIIRGRFSRKEESADIATQLEQTALSALHLFISGPSSPEMLSMHVELPLLDELVWAVEAEKHSLQILLMDVVLLAFRKQAASTTSPKPTHQRTPSKDNTTKASTNLTISTDNVDRKAALVPPTDMLPPKLLHCLTLGLTVRSCRPILDSWVGFLEHCLPLYGRNVFQILIPLVECLCNTLGSAFNSVQATFSGIQDNAVDLYEPTLALLLNGLEQTLATSHAQLITDDVTVATAKSPPTQQQGFFGNMVSGLITPETNQARSATANNRLTVLLCLKDAIRVCYTIWSWDNSGKGSTLKGNSAAATFKYTTLRLQNRTRRIFEHLFAAEALECLETLIELRQSFRPEDYTTRSATLFDLLNVLESSRPKNTMPAIFNAMYSRTNPNALDPTRKSTMTSNLTDTTLVSFLVAYTRSLDDDAMDEIWNDCMTFLRDVLADPMPHRQVLASLLEFAAVLGEKVDNTNFGEQKKMRRELGDLFSRLLTATLTTRPIGREAPSSDKLSVEATNSRVSSESRALAGPEGLVSVLATVVPIISKVLIDSDRVGTTTAIISTQVVGPTIRSKIFPENITKSFLDLLMALATIPEASKPWKRDITEAFNDSKFFHNSLALVETGWIPILRQWSLADKERMPELLSRLTTPTAAGIMFGVGASSARLAADRTTQLNLRRIAVLICSAADDTFIVNLPTLQEKMIDLLNATAASSPSSNTRAEIYMVIRALLLKSSAIHLSPLWPTVNGELFDAISSEFPGHEGEALNTTSLLQACKLLDILLTLGLDDFLMQEWLFITDTTDAVYRPSNFDSAALVDELAEGLDAVATQPSRSNSFSALQHGEKRKPMLASVVVKDLAKEDLMDRVLRPFFRQLSIHTFESIYSMEDVDTKACFDDLMADLFDDGTLV